MPRAPYDARMLIVLPPSETKRGAPDHGDPVDLDALSFPALTPTRARVIEALVETSAGPDAFRRLLVRPTHAADVARNAHLLDVPALPALEVYRGPLHLGLDAASLSAAARERADRQLVVASSLWGALRPADRIPPYRLHVCARLAGIDRLEPVWREVLPAVLTEAAGPTGIVVDLRSDGYRAIGLPDGLGARTVICRVSQSDLGGRRIGDVVAKRARGEAARHLLDRGTDPEDAGELASVLGERWVVDLEGGLRGRPATLTLFVTD